jgi:putative transposase
MGKRRVAAVDDGWRIPDELWAYVEPLLPTPAPQPKGGHPWTPARPLLDGIFFVLRTGCQWKAVPRCFGAPSTVHDRFVLWAKAGVFRRLWQAGLLAFDSRIGLDWEWQAMDGAMTKAPLGGGEHRPQPDRPGQAGHQTVGVDRRAWVAYWPERRRSQSA